MHARTIPGFCGMALLALLAGCEPNRSEPPVPTPTVMVTGTPAAEPSVPSAAAVLGAAAPASAPLPAGRTNNALSRADESSAMPLPGQNNDHSAALAPPKPASTP